MTSADAATVLAAAVAIAIGASLRPVPHRLPVDAPDRSDVRTLVRNPGRRRSRRGPAGARAVAAWCDELSRELRGGSTLRRALSDVVPDDDTIARRTAPLRLGLDRALTVADATARVEGPGRHLQLALGVIVAASDVGGSAAAAIDRVAGTLRQRAADDDERRVQAAQARLSAHVMTAVPLLMLGLLVASDDDVRGVLSTPIGAACLIAGLVLNAAGWCWMRRIVGGHP
jgi:tight adherence protein B